MPDQTTQDNTQQDTSGTTQAANGETPAPTWETILQGLPEDQRTAYEAHTKGLKTALDSERQAHKDLEKQVREAADKAKGEAKAELDRLAQQLESANRQADFYKEAGSPEIGCASPELAYLAAEKDGLFDRRGAVNWVTLKERYPVLFTQQQPARGNAGSGTQTPPTPAQDMNTWIRRAAGRQ